MLITLVSFGAGARRAGPLMIFSVVALFFAGTFCLFWMDLGVPSTLIHHNCNKIEHSFIRNQSSLFPGIQMAGLLYKESDGFTNFDEVQDNLNHEVSIDFNELLPEQEKVFQMIRSCFWEGDAQPELLDVVGLSHLLNTERDFSRRLIILINGKVHPFGSSLPEKVTPEAVSNLSWGPSINNSLSIEAITMLVSEVISYTEAVEKSHPLLFLSIQNEIYALVDHLTAFQALIDLSDCSHMRNLYNRDIRENLCHNFVENVHSLSCFFGLLSLGTVILFFLSFCTGHRTLARLERLEHADYLKRRREEDEEEQACDNSIPEQTKEDCDKPLDAEHLAQSLLVEEKSMPVYDQNGQQVLDLVYIPPPIYFYGQQPNEPQQ